MIEVQIAIGVIMGIIAACIASSKGRNVVGWFFGGFFLGIIGIVIVACISNLKDDTRRNQHADRERRLLREQLQQERLKSQAFQQYANARLARHDQVLEIDTSSHQSLPSLQSVDTPKISAGGGNDELNRLVEASGASPPPRQAQAAVPPVQPQGRRWFVYINNKRYGPGGTEKIIEMVRNGKINADAYVWTDGMDQPDRIGNVPALANML